MWGLPLLGYLGITVVVSAAAGAIGETFFPAELIGDTGENDFAGLAFMLWGCGAFVLCLIGIVAFEVFRARRRAGG